MAIAFDAASGETKAASGTTVSHSHTCTGSNLILFAGVVDQKGGLANVTGVTYNGVAMTKIAEHTNDATGLAGDGTSSLWYLLNPSTGSHTLQATRTVDLNGFILNGTSYTGALQSGIPDASASNYTTSDPFDMTLTTVLDNCWAVAIGYTRTATTVAGTGTTLRTSSTNQSGLVDGNGVKTPAGSYTLQINPSGGDSFSWVMASFAPNVAAATLTPSVNDTVTITENIQLIVKDLPSVNDTVTITENVKMQLNDLPSVNDTTTITESVTVRSIAMPSVSDSVTITENVTILIPTLVPSIVDNVTITENVSVAINTSISVFDSATVTENTTITPTVNISVFDYVYVVEPSLNLVYDGSSAVQVFGGSGSSEESAQSFVAVGSSISSVDVYLKKTGSPVDNILVDIVSTLDGSSLGNVTTAASTISTSMTQYTMTFSSPVAVTKGNTYYVQISRDGARSTSNYLSVGANATVTGVPYTSGARQVRFNGIWSSDNTSNLAVSPTFPGDVSVVQVLLLYGPFLGENFESYGAADIDGGSGGYGWLVNNNATGDYAINWTKGAGGFTGVIATQNSVVRSGTYAAGMSVSGTFNVGTGWQAAYARTNFPFSGGLIQIALYSGSNTSNILDGIGFFSDLAGNVGNFYIARSGTNISLSNWEGTSSTGTSTTTANTWYDIQVSLSGTSARIRKKKAADTDYGQWFGPIVTDDPVVACSLLFSEITSGTITETDYIDDFIVSDSVVVDYVSVSENVSIKIIANVSPSEDVTVTENISIIIPTVPLSISENVTVTDVPTIFTSILTLQIFDAVSVSENTTLNIPLPISIFDTITVSENTSLSVPLPFSVLENITTAEAVSIQVVLPISTSENITVSDVPTIYIPTLVPSVFDTVTVSENVTIEILTKVSAVDTVTVSESITLSIPLPISVFEDVTVTESFQLIDVDNEIIFDTITVSESIALSIPLPVSVLDTITISESITTFIPTLKPLFFETISVSESISLNIPVNVSLFDAVTISENLSVQFGADVVTDTITVTEEIILVIPILFLSVSDNITITESTIQQVGVYISTFDDVFVSESFQVVDVDNEVIFDTVTVSENVVIDIPVTLSVSDTITVSESTSLNANYKISPIDIVAVSENITFNIVLPITSVSDTVTISESITLLIPALVIGVVSDNVTVTESVQIIDIDNVQLSETVNVTESVTLFIPTLAPSAFETLVVSENFASNTVSYINSTESIVVTDVPTVDMKVKFSTNDNITVSESFVSETIIFGPQIPAYRPRGYTGIDAGFEYGGSGPRYAGYTTGGSSGADTGYNYGGVL